MRVTLPMLAVGAKGVITVTAQCRACGHGRNDRCLAAGDSAKARQLHYKLYPLFQAVFWRPIRFRLSTRSP